MVNYTIALGILKALEKVKGSKGKQFFDMAPFQGVSIGVSLSLVAWLLLSLMLFKPSQGTLPVAAIHPALQVQDAADEFRLGMLFDATRTVGF